MRTVEITAGLRGALWKPVVSLVAVFVESFTHIATADSLLLSNAVVHTISGEKITGGQVMVVDGRISAVDSEVSASEATVSDLPGQHLYPGIIALATILGLAEIGAVRATLDSTESGEYTPDVESWIAANPDSELIGVTRASGVAFFEPVP